MHQDTPPASPDMEDSTNDDDDMIYIEDADEVINTLEEQGNVETEDMEEERIETDCASYVFQGHKVGSVFCGSLNKNGKLAATGGEEDKAYVWNAATGEILIDCTDHKDSVIFAEFNFDDSYVATGDMSGTIHVWDLNEKNLIWDYSMGDVTWMKWHAAANVLFAGSVEGEIYMWKVPTGDCKIFQGHGVRAETAVIMPDGKRIAVGYEDGTIKVMDLKTSTVLSSVSSKLGHSSAVTALDCHLDNNLIISAAIDGKTILSTTETGKIVNVLQTLNSNKDRSISDANKDGETSNENKDSNWVETVAFCKDPAFQVAATGTVNGEIFIWDIVKQILRQKINQESGISKLLWKGTTSLLFSAGLDGILRCFDAKIGQCIKSFLGHEADILDLYISEDESTVLTTSDDTTAQIFDIRFLK